MFPVILDIAHVPVMLVGEGEAALKRLRQLDEAGATQVRVFAPEPQKELAREAGWRLQRNLPAMEDMLDVSIIFIVGMEESVSQNLYEQAKALHIPVNVEDVTALCDFHIPALVRRGDLLLTVSTGGKSPALARRLREHLAESFGPEWAGYVSEIAAERLRLKRAGRGMADVLQACTDFVRDKGWLKQARPATERVLEKQ